MHTPFYFRERDRNRHQVRPYVNVAKPFKKCSPLELATRKSVIIFASIIQEGKPREKQISLFKHKQMYLHKIQIYDENNEVKK